MTAGGERMIKMRLEDCHLKVILTVRNNMKKMRKKEVSKALRVNKYHFLTVATEVQEAYLSVDGGRSFRDLLTGE